jgi:hypothetical protein
MQYKYTFSFKQIRLSFFLTNNYYTNIDFMKLKVKLSIYNFDWSLKHIFVQTLP